MDQVTGWQICREGQVELSGAKARDGQRWNSPGRALVYLSEHPALAVLEARVHLDMPYAEVTHDHVLVRVALPADVEVVAAMPEDPRAIGDGWIAGGRSAVLSVPSMVLQQGRNLLLNPAHPRAQEARIVAITPFRFDARLWGGCP